MQSHSDLTPGTLSRLKAQKALLKLRVLGAGYTLAEALEEIQLRSQEYPGLARETLPATLLTVLTSQTGETLHAVERMLLQLLADPVFPETLRAFFSLKLAVHRKEWKGALNHAIRSMELLAGSGLEADRLLGLYGYFYPPIGLGKGFNSDLNLAYKQDLAMEKPQGYLNILFAQCCMESAPVNCSLLRRLPKSLRPNGCVPKPPSRAERLGQYWVL